MPARLVFQFPQAYDQAIMGQFLVALNQRLEELENRLKGTGGGESAEISATRAITLTDVTNNLSIGRGVKIEIVALGTNVVLTGMTGGTNGRVVILKNSAASTNSITIVHEASGSTIGNRFTTRNGGSLVIPGNGARAFIYSQDARAWLPLSEVP